MVKKTVNDVWIISCEILDSLFTWVSASYAVWDNMRIQPDGFMSMWCGMINYEPGKQRINIKVQHK